MRDATLTDDPLHTRRALLSLQKGQKIALRAALGLHWLYAETTAKDGSPLCGFIPAKAVLADHALTDEAPGMAAMVKTSSGALNLRIKPFSDAETICRIPIRRRLPCWSEARNGAAWNIRIVAVS